MQNETLPLAMNGEQVTLILLALLALTVVCLLLFFVFGWKRHLAHTKAASLGRGLGSLLILTTSLQIALISFLLWLVLAVHNGDGLVFWSNSVSIFRNALRISGVAIFALCVGVNQFSGRTLRYANVAAFLVGALLWGKIAFSLNGLWFE